MLYGKKLGRRPTNKEVAKKLRTSESNVSVRKSQIRMIDPNALRSEEVTNEYALPFSDGQKEIIYARNETEDKIR